MTNMNNKETDDRIRRLIENGVKLGHRTMFFIIGDSARGQVVNLHQMLAKSSSSSRPLLWCYKEDLDFNRPDKERMQKLQRKIKGNSLNGNKIDPFELFIASNKIRYCNYSDSQKLLGNTYKMCILQNYEALTPNLLARTIETVEGGGLIIFLLPSMNSLKELYQSSMDIHENYLTAAYQEVVGRFNERFLLSLDKCKRCLVLDDKLNILPLASQNQYQPKKILSEESEEELEQIKEELKDTQPAGTLINCSKTADQAKALLKCIEAIADKNLRSTISLTGTRGRGKTATLGLAIAGAIAYDYSNIFVTSPNPENLSTLFEFIFQGFDALEYKEDTDYDIIQSTNPEFKKAIVRVNIFRDYRQTIQYIHPSDYHKIGHADLVVIDEAAAIPLHLVLSLLGTHLVLMASTINGYEGTGRLLSHKLLQKLREQAATIGQNMPSESSAAAKGRALHEIELNKSIRYKPQDNIERWLTSLLCLDSAIVNPIMSGCPPPENCNLYYINRDTLFSYHPANEGFLQRIVSLYLASSYKNNPNDLQMMSDAPEQHLFCLLGPVDPNSKSLSEILVFIQVSLEGKISLSSSSNEKRAPGDILSWDVARANRDKTFPQLSGARIVRIATHSNYQSMGYGRCALELLHKYYRHELKILINENISEVIKEQETEIKSKNDENVSIYEERIEPRDSLPPLLSKLSDRTPEHIDYLGVSYELTAPLLRFWKRAGFVPVYIRPTKNDITDEHNCIMLSSITPNSDWLRDYYIDFRQRVINRPRIPPELPASLALSLLSSNVFNIVNKDLTRSKMLPWLTTHDIQRLEIYSSNLTDYLFIIDMLPVLARFYFLGMFGETTLSDVQSAIVLGIGLQHKKMEKLASELDLTSSQLLGLFNRIIRRFSQYLTTVLERATENDLKKKSSKNINEEEISQSIASNHEESVKEYTENQTEELLSPNLNQSINKEEESDEIESENYSSAEKKKNNSLTKKRKKRSSGELKNDSLTEEPTKKKRQINKKKNFKKF